MPAHRGVIRQNTQNSGSKQAFAGAGRTCNGNDLPGIYRQIQIGDHLQILLFKSLVIHAKGHGQVMYFQ